MHWENEESERTVTKTQITQRQAAAAADAEVRWKKNHTIEKSIALSDFYCEQCQKQLEEIDMDGDGDALACTEVC